MFELIGRVENSLRDYQSLLKYKRYMIRDHDVKSLEMAIEDDDFENMLDEETEYQEDA
jgi:hypothetical protein